MKNAHKCVSYDLGKLRDDSEKLDVFISTF